MKATFQALLWLIIIGWQAEVSAQDEGPGWGDKVQYQLSIDALFQKGSVDQAASFTAWYFLKDKIGVGSSIGYRNYSTILEESMINTGIEAIFLTGIRQNRIRTFGAFQSGVGFPVFENSGVESTSSLSSRLYVQPQVGLLIDTGRSTSIKISFGYINQGLNLRFEQAQSDINLNYSRYVTSIGIVF